MSGIENSGPVNEALGVIRGMYRTSFGWELREGAIRHTEKRALGFALSPFGYDLFNNPRHEGKAKTLPEYSSSAPNKHQIAAIYGVSLDIAGILSLACSGAPQADRIVRAELLRRCGDPPCGAHQWATREVESLGYTDGEERACRHCGTREFKPLGSKEWITL